MGTDICDRLHRRRVNENLQELQAAVDSVTFKVNGIEIERVSSFNYLGRRLDQNDDDSNCILANIKKARGLWGNISNILKREGANAVTMSKFYRAIVQSVLLYGADSWIVKQSDLKKLRSFHHRAMRYMTGIHIKQKENDEWFYPDHEELMKTCRVLEIDRYLEARRGTLKGYIETFHPNFWRDVEDVRPPARSSEKILWWKQVIISKRELHQVKRDWLDLK